MKVIRAEEMGMCFGVRDALAAARAIERPSEVAIHGELVHNPEVLAELAARGFEQVAERERCALPQRPRLLITAHGVSQRERHRLELAGKELVDTTCPLVRFVHDSAQALASQGCFVLVVGRPSHVEVQGICGDLDRFEVVPDAASARAYGEARLGVVSQSTVPPGHYAETVAAIRLANTGAEIRVLDTICGPTRNRQRAALALLDRVDAVVVVGGRRSNNTLELVRLASSRGLPALHVESASELDPEWCSRFAVIGLTAGTSTLDHTVDDVHDALRALTTRAETASLTSV